MTGDVTTRNKMLKLIPHIDSGNWVVRQAVGTKPVITGKVGACEGRVYSGYVKVRAFGCDCGKLCCCPDTARVLLGLTCTQALKTTYHTTRQYIEIDIDVSANSTAAYITGMVRGATSGLVIDLGEGQHRGQNPSQVF